MTDEDNSPSAADAREALEAVRMVRTQVSEQMGQSSWRYDLGYSGLVGLMIAGQGLPAPLNTLSAAGCAIGLVLLAKAWANKVGVWVSGVSPRRARWVAIGLGGVLAVLMLGVMFLSRKTGLWQVAVGAGVVGAVLAFVASRLWWRVYRAESQVRR